MKNYNKSTNKKIKQLEDASPAYYEDNPKSRAATAKSSTALSESSITKLKKQKQKILTLGCSFSAFGHLKSWPERIVEHFVKNFDKVELINLALPASSNQLQILRLQEYVIYNNIDSDDIVIWQITATVRGHQRSKNSEGKRNKDLTNPTAFYTGSTNYFDKKNRLDYLCHHPISLNMQVDEPEILQQLLYNLKILKKFTNKVMVIKGWEGVIPEEYLKDFYLFLDKNSISYIDEAILTHNIENNYPLGEDKMHPSEEAYVSFTDKKIIPLIKKMGWL